MQQFARPWDRPNMAVTQSQPIPALVLALPIPAPRRLPTTSSGSTTYSSLNIASDGTDEIAATVTSARPIPAPRTTARTSPTTTTTTETIRPPTPFSDSAATSGCVVIDGENGGKHLQQGGYTYVRNRASNKKQ